MRRCAPASPAPATFVPMFILALLSVLVFATPASAAPECTIIGTEGDDLLIGTAGADVICGLGGDDTIRGRNGNDVIYAGRGADVVNAGRGHDIVYGGGGDDRLSGLHGRDRLYGQSGEDVLNGGRGRDRLRGGPGSDTCSDVVQPFNMRSCEIDPNETNEGTGGGSLTIVDAGGIQVAASIADAVIALLDASANDGFDLAGGGFRDPAQQVELRKANCGISDYAIWEMPASECSPPTAIPGRSQHELGLAIDFTSDGQLIRSQTDPAFLWLEANAEQFGFFVHPVEPWHWSTTGD